MRIKKNKAPFNSNAKLHHEGRLLSQPSYFSAPASAIRQGESVAAGPRLWLISPAEVPARDACLWERGRAASGRGDMGTCSPGTSEAATLSTQGRRFLVSFNCVTVGRSPSTSQLFVSHLKVQWPPPSTNKTESE